MQVAVGMVPVPHMLAQVTASAGSQGKGRRQLCASVLVRGLGFASDAPGGQDDHDEKNETLCRWHRTVTRSAPRTVALLETTKRH
jgi:hypothetical protein